MNHLEIGEEIAGVSHRVDDTCGKGLIGSLVICPEGMIINIFILMLSTELKVTDIYLGMPSNTNYSFIKFENNHEYFMNELTKYEEYIKLPKK